MLYFKLFFNGVIYYDFVLSLRWIDCYSLLNLWFLGLGFSLEFNIFLHIKFLFVTRWIKNFCSKIDFEFLYWTVVSIKS